MGSAEEELNRKDSLLLYCKGLVEKARGNES
jgi:hypothetical protein